MITGLGSANIWSEDLNNLLPFYRDTLGLKIEFESPDFVVFGGPGTATLGIGTHSDVRGRNADPARHMVGLATDDVAADYQRLIADGVEAVEEPTDFGPVMVATIKDPEGNYIQLIQPL